MSALQEISYYRNIRNEIPNQELAKKLAETEDFEGIAEIVEHLQDKNKSVASDCLKVLYELGYLRPDLIARYVDKFLALLDSKHNRMVWGSMIALATIAPYKPKEIMAKFDLLQTLMEKGTVITVVWGARMIGNLVGAAPKYAEKVMPYITNLLTTCIPRDVATHAEGLLPMINEDNEEVFRAVFESRMDDMSAAQARRMRSVIKKIGTGYKISYLQGGK
ncbi:MAG: hypothetical protein JEZ00_10570 [Anaerolineaceae bacterium]|nr:hypothetical protein [Anaerolineaceae bacterium]